MITQEALSHFYGTSCYHGCTPLARGLKCTDGVHFLEQNGAAWLVDKIAILCTHEMKVRTELEEGGFLVAKLVKKEGGAATFTIEDGDMESIYSENISFTDIGVDEVKIFITGGVIMLSSEY